MDFMCWNDEDDPIVETYDVYLNSDFFNLWLLHYPLRSNFLPYNFDKIKSLRVKPLQYKVEMDIEYDTKNQDYYTGSNYFYSYFEL
jgi:hypothetical protein